MEASLAPAGRAIAQMVSHVHRNGGPPIHSNPGSRMAGGPLLDLELQDTPYLCPRYLNQNVGCPQVQGDQ